MKFWGILTAGALILLGGCAQEQGAYARPSGGCNCAGVTGGRCRCNHCIGENRGNAKCYCGEAHAQCPCGLRRASCDCKHCTGVQGGDDGKGGCACPKQ